MYNLNGKIAVVTGGNSGIGHAIAISLKKCGAKVVILDKNINFSEKDLTDKNILYIEGDLKNLADIDSLYQRTFDVFGKIDIIVACAGVCYKLRVFTRICGLSRLKSQYFCI